MLSGLHELSVAQDNLKQQTSKRSSELKDITQSLQPPLNQLNERITRRNFQQTQNQNR